MYNNLKDLSDNEIVKLIFENKEIFAELIKRYEQKLLRYAMYLTNDINQSQDIVQNTFIKSYINLKSFKSNLSFSSWIYRITHNETVNALKKNKRLYILDDEIETHNPASSCFEEFSQEEIKQNIRKCLDSIPLKYSEVLTLYFLEEKSYEEISDILRLPSGTIGTRIARGKAVLKIQCLKIK